jgi:hypothetical protein
MAMADLGPPAPPGPPWAMSRAVDGEGAAVRRRPRLCSRRIRRRGPPSRCGCWPQLLAPDPPPPEGAEEGFGCRRREQRRDWGRRERES